MKKIFYLLFILNFISFTRYEEPYFSLRILNSDIKDGKFVVFELKNNTNYNYCFVMDTLFPNRGFYHYYPNLFSNPDVILFDYKKEQIFELIRDKSIPELSISDSIMSVKKNTRNEIARTGNDDFNLIMIKSHSSIKLKIHFKLINSLNDESFSYYKLEKGVNYKAKIDYLVTQNFLNKRISSKIKDSIEKKGYRFFIGKLVSNEVPMFFDIISYNKNIEKNSK